jgi:hypothetical protein
MLKPVSDHSALVRPASGVIKTVPVFAAFSTQGSLGRLSSVETEVRWTLEVDFGRGTSVASSRMSSEVMLASERTNETVSSHVESNGVAKNIYINMISSSLNKDHPRKYYFGAIPEP